MKFRAEIDVMPQKALLDPQGKAVHHGLEGIGLRSVTQVRVGKHITLYLESSDREQAAAMVDDACRKLLVNPVMEQFHAELFEE